MSKDILFCFFIMLFIYSSSFAQETDHKNDTEQRINYRRTETNQLLTTDYNKPKEEVFPLGWNTSTFGKGTTGTGVWTELNPKVPRVSYYGLDFINPDTGWACGSSGAIIKTTNGGNDWSIAETPITSLLFKIHTYDGQVVIAAGFENTILRSNDGGETFEQVQSGLGSETTFWGVQMLNDTLGWVCGGFQTLLKTTDAGLNWQQVFPGLNQHYWSLEFLNEQYGFIVCEGGKVLRTTNGGDNWTIIQAGDTRALYTVDIIDSLHIVEAGEYGMQMQYDGGKNVYSSDGGITWVTNPDIPTYEDANWIEFVDRDTGYSVSNDRGLWKTTNRGVSWFKPNTSNYGGDWQIELIEDGTGYYGGEGLNLFKRTNGLENWTKLFLNEDFADVCFISETTGFAVSGWVSTLGELYKTTDGGISWIEVPGGPEGSCITFINDSVGFIGNFRGDVRIFKSTNAGDTWHTMNIIGLTDTTFRVNKIFFLTEQTGWAVTRGVLKTTDGGNNWFAQLDIPFSNFNSVHFVDSLQGWAAARYIWQTSDGGSNWIERTDIPVFMPDDVYFPNLDTGWIAVYTTINPSLFKTTDGGLIWTTIPEVVGARKFRFFPDPAHWFIIGWSRYYETTDGGNSWMEFTNDVPTGVNSFQAPTDTVGYAVGSGGLILKYEGDTITNQSEEDVLPKLNSFILHQNYPNPFNPTTKIKFTIPTVKRFAESINKTERIGNSLYNVQLKVYDVLGNEIATLVDEEKPPGIYEVEFQSAVGDRQLASGIYYYQLKAGDFVETKKMILLR